MKSSNLTLLFSVDADDRIGSGHLMRCLSIANAASERGVRVVFVISNEYAYSLVQKRGYEAIRVSRDEMSYSTEDARTLVHIFMESDAHTMLVDSYAINESFFSELTQRIGSNSLFYIDDLFLFSDGHICEPKIWPVKGVINYGFGARIEDYEKGYAGTNAVLLIGPQYAPVRKVFCDDAYEVREHIRKVLITSGSTNPDHVLERMCAAAVAVLPNCQVDVVVGAKAQFDEKSMIGRNILAGIDDMSYLMKACDMAISAGGTTLYELAAIGVPTVAIPIVENQMENVMSFGALGLGRAIQRLDASVRDIAHEVAKLACSAPMRRGYSERMRSLRIENGSSLIADALMLACR